MRSRNSSTLSPDMDFTPPVRWTSPRSSVRPFRSLGSATVPPRTMARNWICGSWWSSTMRRRIPLGSVSWRTWGSLMSLSLG